MERVTFPDAKVRGALAGYVAVKINVDREQNREVCRLYRPQGGIPAYAIVDPDATLRGQFGGFLEPAPFLKSLASPEPPEPPSPPTALRAGPELDARIQKNIETFNKLFPSKNVGRALRWIGAKPQTADEWVTEHNAALDDLTRLGEPAVPALLKAVEHGSSRTSERCAVVLGRIKANGAKQAVAALLTHRLAHVRAAAAVCMGHYGERAFLPALCARLKDPKELLRVRTEAADAIGGIARGYGGIDDLAVAKALLDATRVDNARLRWECLQALLNIDSPIDLAALFPLMEDRREGFAGQTVSANACWVFTRLSGHYLVRIDGAEFEEYTPNAVSFLKAWHEREKKKLVWDAGRKHYRLRKS